MPPKRIGGGRPSNKGFVSSTYETITSPENAAVARSIAIFGAAVTILASPWCEYLLPP
ncbi:putative TOM core complex subunit Tom6 [Rostrohypoxylon terebratum]|nr:putative TOM core complex subunit Tom6 [Rostrohypoxylon terebratum]